MSAGDRIPVQDVLFSAQRTVEIKEAVKQATVFAEELKQLLLSLSEYIVQGICPREDTILILQRKPVMADMVPMDCRYIAGIDVPCFGVGEEPLAFMWQRKIPLVSELRDCGAGFITAEMGAGCRCRIAAGSKGK